MKITGPSTDVDVLVVGAGPTGLMLANQLGRRGVRSMIIDRHAGPARETRALGVQARTLEIYSVLGQDDNERIMGERLQDWRLSVRWNTELIGFEQHTARVLRICCARTATSDCAAFTATRGRRLLPFRAFGSAC